MPETHQIRALEAWEGASWPLNNLLKCEAAGARHLPAGLGFISENDRVVPSSPGVQ